ncbi:MAG TPA: hypothetical protein VM889_02810, partial [Candidatus Thermoplasmatota archaeon]|nr:hypothetical protein [Candidatus Thermoplasmatota archaeon]
ANQYAAPVHPRPAGGTMSMRGRRQGSPISSANRLPARAPQRPLRDVEREGRAVGARDVVLGEAEARR